MRLHLYLYPTSPSSLFHLSSYLVYGLPTDNAAPPLALGVEHLLDSNLWSNPRAGFTWTKKSLNKVFYSRLSTHHARTNLLQVVTLS